MYTALYRAERPEVFEEILGQEHIVKILRHQIAEDTVGHAYLFCGTRGTGKTTTARILAKGVNCTDPNVSGRPCGKCANCKAISEGNFMDVIEIDAASNNGVENIRELRESVNRRSPYAFDGRVQCFAENTGGTAGKCNVYSGDDGAAEASGDHSFQMPEIRFQACAAESDYGRHETHL